MRLISFSMTEPAFVAGTKTVTRRLGWAGLTRGARLVAVDKAIGLKAGESPRRLGVIEVVSVRRERLDAITPEDVVAEGVENVSTPESFVAGFCKAMRCEPDTLVTRIEFVRVGDA